MQEPSPLAGLYFVSWVGESLQPHLNWVGQVRHQVAPGWYLVCLEDWLHGKGSLLRLAQVGDLKEAFFYDDRFAWASAVKEFTEFERSRFAPPEATK